MVAAKEKSDAGEQQNVEAAQGGKAGARQVPATEVAAGPAKAAEVVPDSQADNARASLECPP